MYILHRSHVILYIQFEIMSIIYSLPIYDDAHAMYIHISVGWEELDT